MRLVNFFLFVEFVEVIYQSQGNQKQEEKDAKASES